MRNRAYNLKRSSRCRLTCTVTVDVYGSAVEFTQRLDFEVIPVNTQKSLSPHIPEQE